MTNAVGTGANSENLDFGDALKYLKGSRESGERAVTIKGWYGSRAKPVVKLQVPDENSKMNMPYLYMEKLDVSAADDEDPILRFPLDLSCESILSSNWMIVK